MYVGSNIYYPMYFVLECYPKPINVLTDTLMSILTLSSNKPLITLHSFLTWGNKACNLKLWSKLIWLFIVTVTLMLTVTATKAIDLLLWTLMVHLQSQWQRMLISLVVTLRWSSVKCSAWLDSPGWSCPGPWWLVTCYSLLVTRYSLLVTRYSSGVVSGKIGYHLYTLPLLVDIQHR